MTERRAVGLTFDEFSAINRTRCTAWHPGFGQPGDAWTGADWSNAMCGEAGETANVVKKLRRIETSVQGNADPAREVLLKALGDEIADTFAYLDLLAQYYGLDLVECAANKFDAVSVREGFPDRMPVRSV